MISITEDLKIDVDEGQYILCIDYHKIDKNGNYVFKNIGYYTSFVGVVRGAKDYLIKSKLKGKDISLTEAVEIVKTTIAEVDKIISQNNKDIYKITGDFYL